MADLLEEYDPLLAAFVTLFQAMALPPGEL